MEQKQDRKSMSRREFIKTAGMTTAGIVAGSLIGSSTNAQTTTAPATGRVLGANSRLNYAVIGVGGMGGGHVGHLDNLQKNGENIKIVAVCDVYKNRALEHAHRVGLGDDAAYFDYRKLLERKDIDVVVIATPDHWHGKIACDAMEAGKHVYVEKPMTRHWEEAVQMYETAKRTKKLVQVGSQGCTDAKWHKSGELVRAGKIGPVIWAQGSYCRNNPAGEWNYGIDPNMTPETCDWNMWLGPAPKRPFSPERFFRWRKYWDYGTGIIGDLWPHRLHPLMIGMALEEWPKRVACVGAIQCNTDKGHGEPRDVAEATLLQVEFPSGAMIFLAGSTVNERGVEDIIRGQKANILLGGGRIEVQPERPFIDEIEGGPVTYEGPGEDQKEHHKNLIKCIREGGKPNCDIELGTRVMAIVCMAEKSYRENKMARFDATKMKII